MRRFYITILSVLLSSAMLLCVSCGNSNSNDSGTEIENGISVEGDGAYSWKPSGKYDKCLKIETDGLTISGTAECSMNIWLQSGVTELKIKDLNQGDYKIDIWFPQDEDGELYYAGNNSIYRIGYCDNVDIYNVNVDDELNITGEVDVFEDLCIYGGVVTAGYLHAYGTVEIMNNTQLSMHAMKHEEEIEIVGGRIEAWEYVFIDLNKDGFVNIKGDGDTLILADEDIKLGENTYVDAPDGYSPGYSSKIDFYCICDEKGKEAEYVLIKSKQ